MQLYLWCAHCNQKITLRSNARTRGELAQQWGTTFYINCPHCQSQGHYSTYNVFAETSPSSTPAAGAIIGGLIGLIFGPEGALIGSAIGGAAGLTKDQNDKNMVAIFNNS